MWEVMWDAGRQLPAYHSHSFALTPHFQKKWESKFQEGYRPEKKRLLKKFSSREKPKHFTIPKDVRFQFFVCSSQCCLYQHVQILITNKCIFLECIKFTVEKVIVTLCIYIYVIDNIQWMKDWCNTETLVFLLANCHQSLAA